MPRQEYIPEQPQIASSNRIYINKMSIKSSRSKKKVTSPSTINPSPWDHSSLQTSRKRVQAIRTQQSSVEMQMNEDIEHSLGQSIYTQNSNKSARKSITVEKNKANETKSIEESCSSPDMVKSAQKLDKKSSESPFGKGRSRMHLANKQSTLTHRDFGVHGQERAIESQETNLKKNPSRVSKQTNGHIQVNDQNSSPRLNSVGNSNQNADNISEKDVLSARFDVTKISSRHRLAPQMPQVPEQKQVEAGFDLEHAEMPLLDFVRTYYSPSFKNVSQNSTVKSRRLAARAEGVKANKAGQRSRLNSQEDYQSMQSRNANARKKKPLSVSQINILSKNPMKYMVELTPMREELEFFPHRKSPQLASELQMPGKSQKFMIQINATKESFNQYARKSNFKDEEAFSQNYRKLHSSQPDMEGIWSKRDTLVDGFTQHPDLKIDGVRSKKFKKGKTMVHNKAFFHDRHQSSQGNQVALQQLSFTQSQLEDYNLASDQDKKPVMEPQTAKNKKNKHDLADIEMASPYGTRYSHLMQCSDSGKGQKNKVARNNAATKTQDKFAKATEGQNELTKSFYDARPDRDKTLPLIGSEKTIKVQSNMQSNFVSRNAGANNMGTANSKYLVLDLSKTGVQQASLLNELSSSKAAGFMEQKRAFQQFRQSLRKSSINTRLSPQYFSQDHQNTSMQIPKKKQSNFQKYVDEQRIDYNHEQLQKAMKRINRYNYSWDSAPDDSLGPRNEKANLINLSNLLNEVRQSDKMDPLEVDILGHIIPCCRKDKNKLDYLEKLTSSGQLSKYQISKVESDVLFDKVQKASTQALQKSVLDLNIDKNQFGLSSTAVPAFSPANKIKKRLRNLYLYHQFKGNKLISNKFLPRKDFVRLKNPVTIKDADLDLGEVLM